MDEFNKSLNLTADFMIKTKIKENEMVESVRSQSSPFGIISCNLEGQYSFNTAMKLKNRWIRNTKGMLYWIRVADTNYLKYIICKGFKTQVIDKVNQKDKVAIHSSEISSCEATIHINDTLWADFLNKHVSKGKRKKFKTSFDDFVSLELQQQGVLCWLKHNFYWFNKSTEYCWRGKFRCIDKNCRIV